MEQLAHHIPASLAKTTTQGQPQPTISRGCKTHKVFTQGCLLCLGANQSAGEEVRKQQAKARQARIEKAIGKAGIPERFRNRDFDGYQATMPKQEHALRVVQEYARRFSDIRKSGTNLILVGSPGTGKSHLAAAALRELIAAGYTGLFIAMSEALRRIRGTYAPRATQTETEVYEALIGPDLLALDEVGVAIGDEEKRRTMMFDIINGRYAAMRPTIIMANMEATELEAYLGERAMDRLMEGGGAIVPFMWESYRRRRS